MATDKVTAIATRPVFPKPVPVEVAYFEAPESQPHIADLIMALDGVCSALDAEQIQFNDEEQLNRIAMLNVAARILARQLTDRQTSKPPTKKQLEETRKASADWAAVRDQARAVQ